MKEHQKRTWKALPNQKCFDRLNSEYCSLGQDIDYYEKLRKLSKNDGKEILDGLNDLIYLDKDDWKRKCPGVEISLLRSPSAKAAWEYGKDIFENKKQTMDDMDFTFSTKLMGVENKHSLKVKFSKSSLLPVRINVIIGKNGTGKTSFLANFAKALVGSKKLDHLNGTFALLPESWTTCISVKRPVY